MQFWQLGNKRLATTSCRRHFQESFVFPTPFNASSARTKLIEDGTPPHITRFSVRIKRNRSSHTSFKNRIMVYMLLKYRQNRYVSYYQIVIIHITDIVIVDCNLWIFRAFICLINYFKYIYRAYN